MPLLGAGGSGALHRQTWRSATAGERCSGQWFRAGLSLQSRSAQAAVSKGHQSWAYGGASSQSLRGHAAAQDVAAKIRHSCRRTDLRARRTLALPGVSVPTEIIRGEKTPLRSHEVTWEQHKNGMIVSCRPPAHFSYKTQTHFWKCGHYTAV